MAKYVGMNEHNAGYGSRTFDVLGFTSASWGTFCVNCQNHPASEEEFPVYYGDLSDDEVTICDACGKALTPENGYLGGDDVEYLEEEEHGR